MITDVNPNPENATEAQKIWQEFLQKCCEYGQLQHALGQLESQQRELEKQVEVTMRAMKSAAAKHKENQQKGLMLKKEEATPTPAMEAH